MTQITVNSFEITNWQHGGSACTLRIQANDSFITSTGDSVNRNYTRSQTFYQTVNCTISSTTITVPSFVIDSTTDSSVPNATYNFILYDSSGIRKLAPYSGFKIPTAFGLNASWAQIATYNAAPVSVLPSSHPTIEQVQILIDAAIGGSEGITLANTYENSLATAISSIGATPTTLVIDEDTTVSTFLVVPSTLVLEQRNNAVIDITSTGQIAFEGLGVVDPMSQTPFFSFSLSTQLASGEYKPFVQANVNATANTITTNAAHGFTTGQQLKYVIHPNWPPAIGGLEYCGTYYAIVTGASVVKLATTYANAIAGTAIDFTDAGGAHSGLMRIPVAWIGTTAPPMVSSEIIDPGTTSLSDRVNILDGAFGVGRSLTIYCHAGRIINTYCPMGDGHSLIFGPGDHDNTFNVAEEFFLPFYMGSNSYFTSEPGAIIYESSVFGRNSIVRTRNDVTNVHIFGNHFKQNGAAFNSSDAGVAIVNASYCSIRNNWCDGLRSYQIGIIQDGYTLDTDTTYTDADVNTADNEITVEDHGYRTGVPCDVATAGTLASPLLAATTYYVIKVDDDTIKLATTYANAIARTAIDLTTTGSGTTTINVTGNTGGNNFECKHNVVDGNLLTGYLTQVLFVIGGQDLKLTNNRIILDEWDEFVVNCSVVDIEPNTQFQHITDLEIAHNLISLRNIPQGYTRGIHLQSIYTDGCERVSIHDNTVLIYADGDIPTLNVAGIIVDYGAADVDVYNNNIVGAGFASIIASMSRRVRIYDNNCTGGSGRMILTSLADSQVYDNKIKDVQEFPETYQFIESDGSGVVTLTYPPGSDTGAAWRWEVGLKVFFNETEYTIATVKANETSVFERVLTTTPTFPADISILSVGAAGIDIINNEITTPSNHLLVTGDYLRVSAGSGATVPGGLVTGNGNFYVIKTANDKFKLAATHADAIAGTPVIDITDVGVGTNTYNPAWILRFGDIRLRDNDADYVLTLNPLSDSILLSTSYDDKITEVADTAYTALINDGVIVYTSLTAGRTVSLPDATVLRGKEYIIKDGSGDAATFNITVDGNGSQTIDGAANIVISADYGMVKVKSNGTGWITL
jgi:hypothetical protein